MKQKQERFMCLPKIQCKIWGYYTCHMMIKISKKHNNSWSSHPKNAAFSTWSESHIKSIKVMSVEGVQIVTRLIVTFEELMMECLK